MGCFGLVTRSVQCKKLTPEDRVLICVLAGGVMSIGRQRGRQCAPLGTSLKRRVRGRARSAMMDSPAVCIESSSSRTSPLSLESARSAGGGQR